MPLMSPLIALATRGARTGVTSPTGARGATASGRPSSAAGAIDGGTRIGGGSRAYHTQYHEAQDTAHERQLAKQRERDAARG